MALELRGSFVVFLFQIPLDLFWTKCCLSSKSLEHLQLLSISHSYWLYCKKCLEHHILWYLFALNNMLSLLLFFLIAYPCWLDEQLMYNYFQFVMDVINRNISMEKKAQAFSYYDDNYLLCRKLQNFSKKQTIPTLVTTHYLMIHHHCHLFRFCSSHY